MDNKGGLQSFLQQLKKQGLSKDEIISTLVTKGVDRKKAELVVNAHIDESESFSDLIQDIKIQKFTDEELGEIRKSLKSELYHEESGLKTFSAKAQSSSPASDINKDALGEIQALKKEMLEKSMKKSTNEELLESSRQELALVKQENARLSGEIKRLDGEVAGLRELMKELISTVREIRSMLK